MNYTIIRNINVVNEGYIKNLDVLIKDDRIEKIEPLINTRNKNLKEVDGTSRYLLPGMIDDQVHFREPGLRYKGNIYSESKAAVAGGITSYMDMPNTIPNTLNIELLEEKYAIASKQSLANYSFFMGINLNNLDLALRIDNEQVCGITDDGLYFHNEEGILANYPEFLHRLFKESNSLIALHSENTSIIKENEAIYRERFGENIPIEYHSKIRSESACLSATKQVLDIQKRYNNRLHFFHISTLLEAQLFNDEIPLSQKRVTAEACIHHLFFTDKDYDRLKSRIKWNPSVKTEQDRKGLLDSILSNKIDIIATDHAPHTWEEKNGTYFKTLSGGPLVQHALIALLELYHEGKISLEKIVEKTSHNVAEIYKIQERGYIREGYFADLAIIDLNKETKVNNTNILYACKWSPFENYVFKSAIDKTFVNGNLVYDRGIINETNRGMRLQFSKFR